MERNTTKDKRNRGEAYVSAYTQNHVPERKIGPLCSCGCMANLGEERIKQLFKDFWRLGDYDKQNSYIHACVQSVEVAKSHVKNRVSR